MKKAMIFLLGVTVGASAFSAATQNVTNLIARLDPLTANVLSNFVALTDIPRSTYHEKAVSDALVAWAQARGFSPVQDAQNNVWFDVPATPGMEAKPLVVLQDHMDMVMAGFDDPLNDRVMLDCDDSGSIFAKDRLTSIGADNGIGLSIALTVADGKIPHGPVRVLVTTDEEQTQTGAVAVPESIFKDVGYFINIDSDNDGDLTISSAANDTMLVTGTVSTVSATLDSAYCVEIENFRGGHSGLDADKGYLNAIIELGRVLTNALANGVFLELANFTGGDADNAIPPHAMAIVKIDEASKTSFEKILSDAQSAFRAYGEANANVALTAMNDITAVFDDSSRKNLLRYLTTVHNGIWGWSKEIPQLVETSVNLGRIWADADGVRIRSSARGSVDERLREEEQAIAQTAESCGYTCMVTRTCAPWPANATNPLVNTFQTAHGILAGKYMRVVAIHAGLECGWFSQKAPGMHIVSIGPTIQGPHTVKETTHASSVSNYVWLLAKALEILPIPSVKLGVVAQRYPWDGKLDVQYKAENAPETGYLAKITVTLPDGRAKSETHNLTNGVHTVTFDAKAAFGQAQVKGANVVVSAIPVQVTEE